MKLKSVIAIALALVMCLTCFAGCAPSTVSNAELVSGGILCLSVNPEIAVHFDKDGNVTRVEARNDDGSAITADYTGYEGTAAHQVVVDLVTAIGEAGYFVEDIDGEGRRITLEIEPGSKLPSETFLMELASAVRDCVNSNDWTAPVDVKDFRDDDRDDGICTNPYCDDNDCDDIDCDDDDLIADDQDDGICTNPYCDDDDCDDIDCDDDDLIDDDQDDGICTNPFCDDDDCDDADCDDNIDDRDDGICINPYCEDDDCDDADCDDNIDDRDDGICINPYCEDNDCDDADCDDNIDDRDDDRDDGICTNPYCDDDDCDDADCDD